MFGNNKPFGTVAPFGGSTFGTTSTFGQTAPGFGAKPTANVFGTAFGTTSNAAPGGLFGTTPSQTGQGLFGSSTGFATPASTGTSTFGAGSAFGATTTTSGLFGSTMQQPGNTSSLFGSTATPSAFGTARPAFGGFGTTTSSSGLFGQPQPTAGLFGQPVSTGGGMFGASTTSFVSGTTIKFNPPTGTDTMMKNGVTTNINTRHQCITCMKDYENKSLEELRFEDYTANRKGPQTVGFGATTQSTGLFGTPTSTSAFSFGSTPNKPLFGGTGTTSAFGTGGTSGLFSQPSQQPAASLFSKPLTAFGSTATSVGSTFNTSGTPSLFGQTAQQKPLFGQPASTGLFGPATTSQPSSVFGTSTFGTGAFGSFGQQQQPGGLLGTKPTTFGAPTASTSASTFNFGSATSTGLFGKPATTSAFGGFGTTPATGMSMFNQPKPASAFGTTNTSFGTTGFGAFGTGTSLFGNTAASKPFSFSTPATNTGYAFGQPNPTMSTLGNFSNIAPTPLGSDPNYAALQQSQQQIASLVTNPYGDSPLFRNILKSSKKREELLQPTNPAIQKSLLQHRVSPGPTTKVKPKPLQTTINGKVSLFEGLEDEDLGEVLFVPRRSVKKLVIKTKPTVTETSETARNSATEPLSVSISESNASPVAIKSPPPPPSAPNDSPVRLISSKFLTNGMDSPNANLPLENTISEMNANPNRPILPLVIEEEEEEPETANERCPGPAGIVLNRSGYYTIPSLEELASFVDEDGNCFVENFTVGRHSYGNVFFPGMVNVANLNLDDLVHIQRKQVTVYPDDSVRPAVGEGLNRKAQVTLDEVWPVDRTTHSIITDPERLRLMNYEDKIESATVRMGAKFVDYRPDTGSWVFEVQHFSKYGLEDSDDDTETTKTPQSGIFIPTTKQPPVAPILNGETAVKVPFFQPVESAPTWEDDSMLQDIIDEPEPVEMTLLEKLEDFRSPLQFDLHGMRASFFPEDENNEKVTEDIFQDEQPDSFVMPTPNGRLLSQSRLAPEPSRGAPRKTVSPSVDILSQFPVLPSGQSEIAPVPRFEPASRPQLKPYDLSLLSDKSDLLCDAACFMGRSFRVGWGTDWKFFHLGTALTEPPRPESGDVAQPFGLLRPTKPKRLNDRCVHLEQVQIQDPTSRDNLEDRFGIQLAHSSCIDEEGIPLFVPQPGTELLTSHAEALKAIGGPASDIWCLGVALWGDAEESSHSYTNRMRRKESLSEWLVEVTRPSLQRDLEKHKQESDYLESLFFLLMGQRIHEACLLAEENHDFRLALLLAQAGSTLTVRNILRQQLQNWLQHKTVKFICKGRLKLFALLCGEPVWSEMDVNCCEGLTWKQTLAFLLWYCCPPTSGIEDAVREYDIAFKGEGVRGKYARPPLPEHSVHSSSSLPDTCYQMLKLYCDRTHRLDRLLAPMAHTSNHLDYSISWFLCQTLRCLGYTHLQPYQESVIHCSFASQLEMSGLWHWSVFVLLHLSDCQRRKSAVMDVLGRHLTLEETAEERFLHDSFSIPLQWIASVKAERARAAGRHEDEAWYLLKSHQWTLAHQTIMEHIAPVAIINEKYTDLRGYLEPISVAEHSATVLDWLVGGQVYLDYIHISQVIDRVLKGEVSAYEVEELQPQVISLAGRISSIKCLSARDRLCQSEMAKKTATLLRAILLVRRRDDQLPSDHLLAPYLSKLPMPEDYALQELRTMTRFYMLDLTKSTE